MSDREPILMRKQLGALRPATQAAQDMLDKLPGDRTFRVEVKGIRGNTRRLALYWCVLAVAAEQLSDAVDGVMSRGLLDDWLRREYGISKPVTSRKTGEIIGYDRGRIAFDKMPETERAAYLDWTIDKLSSRLGCDVTTLRQEAEQNYGVAA